MMLNNNGLRLSQYTPGPDLNEVRAGQWRLDTLLQPKDSTQGEEEIAMGGLTARWFLDAG